MRGWRNPQSAMLTFVNLDEHVPPDHPLRIIKKALTTRSAAWQTVVVTTLSWFP